MHSSAEITIDAARSEPANRVRELERELEALRREMLELETNVFATLRFADASHAASARNLLHYLVLRRHDLRRLQPELAALGLSSLGRCESHVLATIEAVSNALCRLGNREPDAAHALPTTAFDDGRAQLAARTEALLGPTRPCRDVRILVTLPGEAADDFGLVRGLLERGMDCVRINCAHDDARIWERMIANLRRAEELTGRRAKVMMDLAGPKLRTGPIAPGPRVVKIRPKRDEFGRIEQPARIWLSAIGAESTPNAHADASLSVARKWLDELEVGDEIEFFDAREARRRWLVMRTGEGGAWIEARRTCYLIPGLELRHVRDRVEIAKAELGDFEPREGSILLRQGDRLMLTRSLALGRPAELDAYGRLLAPARIGCSLPEIFDDVRAGESVWLDDGRIGGLIRRIDATELEIEITQAGPNGERLRADKGINLPDSRLALPALTAKDVEDLAFIASHADVVALSFVHAPEDVRELEQHLARLGRRDLGIVLKIETRRAFERLPSLVLASLASPSSGVMIARGDLAVECGYQRLAEAQEEILWICEAAHIPVIWATQVLESLAKTGRPSRAEITDAAMGERAECVMLNKGPNILAAVSILDDILARMQGHQHKKSAMLRPLSLARDLEHWTK